MAYLPPVKLHIRWQLMLVLTSKRILFLLLKRASIAKLNKRKL